jgi:hypothetical protein
MDPRQLNSQVAGTIVSAWKQLPAADRQTLKGPVVQALSAAAQSLQTAVAKSPSKPGTTNPDIAKAKSSVAAMATIAQAVQSG